MCVVLETAIGCEDTDSRSPYYQQRKDFIVADPVYKKIELVGTSANSFSEATANAVAKAAESVRNTSWFEVVEQRGSIAEGEIQQYQVTVRIGFRVE